MKVHGRQLEAMGVVSEVPCQPECSEMRHWEITYAPPGKSASEIWESWEIQHKDWVIVLAVKPAPEAGPPSPAFISAHGEPESLTNSYQPWRVQFVFRDTLKRASVLN